MGITYPDFMIGTHFFNPQYNKPCKFQPAFLYFFGTEGVLINKNSDIKKEIAESLSA